MKRKIKKDIPSIILALIIFIMPFFLFISFPHPIQTIEIELSNSKPFLILDDVAFCRFQQGIFTVKNIDEKSYLFCHSLFNEVSNKKRYNEFGDFFSEYYDTPFSTNNKQYKIEEKINSGGRVIFDIVNLSDSRKIEWGFKFD